MDEPKKIYVNRPQMEVQMVQAFTTICEWSRGTGKSSGAIAPRTEKCVFDMPRSHGAYVAKSHMQLFTRTLPEVIKGLAMRGYVRDRDYFIGRFAPSAWKWDMPFAPPIKADYFMHWRCGSGISFISQDRPGMAAGLSLDWIIGDEAKHLNQQLFEEELMPANRGNRGAWDGKHKDPRINGSLHHSVMLCSDTPVSLSGKWFIEKEKEHTPDKVAELFALEKKAQHYRMLLAKAPTKVTAKKYITLINELNALTRRIRRGDPERYIRTRDPKYKPSYHFSRANVWDNIHVLGLEYVDQMKRDLPDLIFRTSILNERISQVGQGFYPDLAEDVHGYHNYDSGYIEAAGYDFQPNDELDSRKDGDLDPHAAIDMAPDYGGNFNCIVLGQHHGTEYRFVNAMYVKEGQKIRHLVAKFKRYYRHHKRKEVNFFYDHTGKRTDAINDTSYHLEYINLLQSSDEYGAWKVNEIYCGRTPAPQARYEFWNVILTESADFPKFRYNIDNCEYWAISAMMAPMKVGLRGAEKDKKSEKQDPDGNFRVPQEEATHLSDAGDTLAFFRMHRTEQPSDGPALSLMISKR